MNERIDPDLLRRLTILYVEDDDDVRVRLAALLRLWVGRVITAENGVEALACFAQERPHLVITDIQMPMMDGLALAAALKEREPDTPVIVTTACNEQDYFLKAIDLGVDNYVIKPIDTDQLLAAITKAARIESQRRQLRDDLTVTHYLIDRMMLAERMRDEQLRFWSRPTQQFNGDMIAALRSRNRDLYLFLADASGHGLPAAVNLLPLVRIFYTMAEKGFAVSVIADEMNRTLREQSPADRFVAATIVRVNNPNRTIEVWNGGNPSALLLDEAGRVRHQFRSNHLALGIIGDDGFQHDTEIAQWSGRGELYLCSDGFIEAMNEAGAPFGEERLHAALAGNEVHSRFSEVMKAWHLFLGDARAHDDASLMAVECPRGKGK